MGSTFTKAKVNTPHTHLWVLAARKETGSAQWASYCFRGSFNDRTERPSYKANSCFHSPYIVTSTHNWETQGERPGGCGAEGDRHHPTSAIICNNLQTFSQIMKEPGLSRQPDTHLTALHQVTPVQMPEEHLVPNLVYPASTSKSIHFSDFNKFPRLPTFPS